MKSPAASGSSAHSEHVEQVTFINWFRRTHPGVLIFAVPNGGYRSAATAGRLKAEGVVQGIPDLFVPAWGLWIEVKRAKGGRVSPEQRAVMAYLEQAGYTCCVARGCDEAVELVNRFALLNPEKIGIAARPVSD